MNQTPVMTSNPRNSHDIKILGNHGSESESVSESTRSPKVKTLKVYTRDQQMTEHDDTSLPSSTGAASRRYVEDLARLT